MALDEPGWNDIADALLARDYADARRLLGDVDLGGYGCRMLVDWVLEGDDADGLALVLEFYPHLWATAAEECRWRRARDCARRLREFRPRTVRDFDWGWLDDSSDEPDEPDDDSADWGENHP